MAIFRVTETVTAVRELFYEAINEEDAMKMWARGDDCLFENPYAFCDDADISAVEEVD